MDLQTFFESFTGQLIVVIIIAAILAVIFFLSGKDKKTHARTIAISAALIAMAFVLNNFVPRIRLANGGSITLFSMFVLFYVGYCFGTRNGILAGMAYGLLDFLISPSAYYPMQIVLDYILAFGLIGAGSILRKQKYGIITGYLLGVLGRYIASVMSGVIFFAEYAPEGLSPLVYSLLYNISYMGIEAAATVIVLLIKPVRITLENLAKKYGI